MEYISPETLVKVTRVLKRWKGRAKLIAGGTNVIPDVRAKVLKPDALIDLSHLKNPSYIKEEKKKIRIGVLLPFRNGPPQRAFNITPPSFLGLPINSEIHW